MGHIARNADGSYTFEATSPQSKAEALALVKQEGQVLGIPGWAWRAEHRLDRDGAVVYRYLTATPEALERQWQALVRAGVLPQGTPRPLILESARSDERKVRTTPPEALLRKLQEPNVSRLKDIWPGYILGESDAEMGARAGVSATTVRRLREAAGLPTMLVGSGVKEQLPDICFEIPSTAQSKGAVTVDREIFEIVRLLGMTHIIREGTTWREVFNAIQDALRDLQQGNTTTLKSLNARIRNQRKELELLQQRAHPKIRTIHIYEGRVAKNVTLIFDDGVEANLSVPNRTNLLGIREALVNAGWRGVPQVDEFQQTYPGQYRHPPQEVLLEVNVSKVDPGRKDLGLSRPPEGSFYKARDPFMARALAEAGLPYRVPSADGKQWVQYVPGKVVLWGSR